MRAFSKTTIGATLVALVIGLGAVTASAAPVWIPHGGAPHGAMPHGGGMPHPMGRGHTGGRFGVGAGLLGGFAAGTILGSAYGPYDYSYDYGNGCYQYRPTYDQFGRYLGQHLVDVCPQ